MTKKPKRAGKKRMAVTKGWALKRSDGTLVGNPSIYTSLRCAVMCNPNSSWKPVQVEIREVKDSK